MRADTHTDTAASVDRAAAYWERVRRIVDQAPPLTDEQRAKIRCAFHQPTARAAA